MYVVNGWCFSIHALSIALHSISFSAAPDDYIRNTPVILEFLKCVNTSQCHSIDLLEDDLLERDDTFNVTIEEVSPLDKNRIALGPVNAQVEILDDMSRKYVSL